MTHIELILLLIVVYLLDCLVIVPEGSVVFVKWPPFGRFTMQRPRFPIFNRRFGVAFANPLPPLGLALPSRPSPLQFSPTGIASNSAPDAAESRGRFAEFREIRGVDVSERAVVVNGAVFAQAASDRLAAEAASSLRRLLARTGGERSQAVSLLARQSMDVSQIQKKVEEFGRMTAVLRVFCNLLFLHMFVLLPLFVSSVLFPYWLAAIAVLELPILLLFWRCRRRLNPGESGWAAAQALLHILPPPSAVRAHDYLSSPLLDGFHPLAAALAVADRRAVRDLARRHLIEVHHPRPLDETENSSGKRIRREIVELQKKLLEATLADHGLSPGEMLQPPEREPGCLSFCPKCRNQYLGAPVECPECPGIGVQPFD